MTPAYAATFDYSIRRVYLKSLSVEVPHMAKLPQWADSPKMGLDMQTEAQPAGQDVMECVLRIILQAKLHNETLFVIEVKEAGLFELRGNPSPSDVTRFVRQIAAADLFPYARKDLAALAVAAGFQPVLLDHVDFDALLSQVIKQHRGRTTTALPAHTPLTTPPTKQNIKEEPTQPAVIEEPPSSRSKKLWVVLLLLMLTAGAATLGWHDREEALAWLPMPKHVETAPTPMAPQPPPRLLDGAMAQALELSQPAWLDQNPDWFTILWKEVAFDLPPPDLEPYAKILDGQPVYFHMTGPDKVGIHIGAFNSTELAQRTLEKLIKPNQGAASEGGEPMPPIIVKFLR